MPFKYYHGKTARVWNVSRRALGVQVDKVVRQRVIRKRFHIRVEHVRLSRSRESFLQRVKENERIRAEAAATGVKAKRTFRDCFLANEVAVIKRTPAQPKSGRFVRTKSNVPEDLHPLPYELVA